MFVVRNVCVTLDRMFNVCCTDPREFTLDSNGRYIKIGKVPYRTWLRQGLDSVFTGKTAGYPRLLEHCTNAKAHLLAFSLQLRIYNQTR